jgi:hypothetical protein
VAGLTALQKEFERERDKSKEEDAKRDSTKTGEKG